MLTVHHHNHNQNSNTERSAMKMTIKQFDRNSMRLLAGACSLCILLALAPAAFAQQGAPALGGIHQVSGSTAFAPLASIQAASPAAGAVQAAKPLASLASTEEENAPANSAKSGGGGIKVHGHWVIDVRNPDGALVQHHEFENSLQSIGQGFLVGLQSGYMTPGDYMIVLVGTGATNSPCAATNAYCGIAHSLSTYPALNYCTTMYCTGSSLSYAYNFGAAFAGPYSMVLSGSIAANQTGVIGAVSTAMALCSNVGLAAVPSTIETSSPATCATQTTPEPYFGPLTGTTLTTPVPITSGQIIQVTVTISFS
jgi:hypothetical protein